MKRAAKLPVPAGDFRRVGRRTPPDRSELLIVFRRCIRGVSAQPLGHRSARRQLAARKSSTRWNGRSAARVAAELQGTTSDAGGPRAVRRVRSSAGPRRHASGYGHRLYQLQLQRHRRRDAPASGRPGIARHGNRRALLREVNNLQRTLLEATHNQFELSLADADEP